MITLGAFLVFLVAASLPVTYIFLMSRWIEPEARLAGIREPAPEEQTHTRRELVESHA